MVPTRFFTAMHFPFYVVPPVPFRCRKMKAESTRHPPFIGEAGSSVPVPYLAGCTAHLQCANCAVNICMTSQIISKGFTGRHGRAYLVAPSCYSSDQSQLALELPNTKADNPSQRQLVTGIHTVSDVRCAFCNSMLGWKYDGAEEESQRYKVGKYILETKMVCSSSLWEQRPRETMNTPEQQRATTLVGEQHSTKVSFDSEDEEECEDLFAGVWSPSLATKRRQARTFQRPGRHPETCLVPGPTR